MRRSQAIAFGVIDPLLQCRARPCRSAAAQMNRRRKSPLSDPTVDRRTAERAYPHHVVQTVERWRSFRGRWLGQWPVKKHWRVLPDVTEEGCVPRRPRQTRSGRCAPARLSSCVTSTSAAPAVLWGTGKVVEIAHARRCFGYRRIHDLLRPEFPGVNHKRVHRLYSEANLAVRSRKKANRLALGACAGATSLGRLPGVEHGLCQRLANAMRRSVVNANT